MREIKFRIWYKAGKRWLDYDEIFIDQDGEVYEIEERTRAYQSYMHKERITEKVDVVRFTGLKDRNSKEIYESDLITITHPFTNHEAIGVAEVVFSYDYDGGWVAQSGDNHLNIGTRTHMVSVLGNIYENPELLEGAK